MREIWPVLVPLLAICGWIIITVVKTIARGRVRELEIRERIAMIEKGLVPPPEVDPRGFDRAMNRYERREVRHARRAGVEGARHRRAGVILLGVGFGIMILIAFAGEEPRRAIGIGGFIVILGLAFLLNSLFEPAGPTTPLPSPKSDEPLPPPPPAAS